MAALSAAVLVSAVLLGVGGCGRLEEECRGVSNTANAFIAESERQPSKPGSTPEETARDALATAARYDKLAADLAALDVRSSKLAPEVERYRALAQQSAASLRDVAKTLEQGDFETARKKRVELAGAARGEGPLVQRINELCGIRPGTPRADAGAARP